MGRRRPQRALRFIEYDIAARLSEIYRIHEVLGANVEEQLGNAVLASVAPDDPASGPSLRLFGLTLADIAAAETILLDLYRKHLPEIEAAANSGGAVNKGAAHAVSACEVVDAKAIG